MTAARATARLILLLALGVGILVDVLVPGNASGLNVGIVTAVLLAAALGVAGREGRARFDPADAWLPAGAVVFVVLPAVRADDWLVEADLLLAAALAAGTIACLGGARITRGLVPAVLAASVGVLTAAATGAASVLSRLRPRVRAEDEDGPSSSRFGSAAIRTRLARATPVLRGLALAIPVVALFALLFASADAVFAELARGAIAWRLNLDLGNVAERTVVVTTVAWGTAGLLALAAGILPGVLPGRSPDRGGQSGPRRPSIAGEPLVPGPPAPPQTGWTPPRGRSLGAASAADLARAPRLGTVEASTILALVAALFAGFVLL